MPEKNKIIFEEYGIEFDEDEFENMSEEELKRCEELLHKIENLLV